VEEGVVQSLLDAGDGAGALERAVALVQRHLGLDAVFVAELTAQALEYRAVAGDAAAFGISVGAAMPRAETYCQRLVDGAIPRLIRDTSADARVAALPGTKDAHVGAYIGVPLYYSDGTVYGAVCGLSREADESLDDRDVRFLAMLADLLVGHIDEQRDLARLHSSMTALISGERLKIAAQPVVRLSDGRCVGVEALSRFPPAFGRPDLVFAAADTVGLGVELERLAVSRAWPLLSHLAADQFLSVNLSPAAATVLSERAQRSDELPMPRLVVEITEHSVIDSYADLRAVLQPLRDAGLRVAVDDAGAGYASLRHVVELRPDFIKIDRDLVHGLADDHARRVAVSAFVLLALDLDATVIAEGLERPADLAALCDLGVDAAQGFLLGRPSTSERQVRKWLRSTSVTAVRARSA
jgi:EAL domain-containing protein (putative c-di-GMP-specific phosphodiesterase class I)